MQTKTGIFTIVHNTPDTPTILDLTAEDSGPFGGWTLYENPTKTTPVAAIFGEWTIEQIIPTDEIVAIFGEWTLTEAS